MRTKLAVRVSLLVVLTFSSAAMCSSPTAPVGRTENGVVLISRNSVWAYDATGMDLKTSRKDTAYDAGGRPVGAGILGYGENYINAAIPFGPDLNSKYTTTFFRRTFDLPTDPSRVSRLVIAANYDDGFVSYLNGQEVARPGMPGGAIGYGAFAASYEGGTYEVIDLGADSDRLVAGSNLLAVEVHQTSPSSSDLVWDTELTYDTSSVEFVWSGAMTPTSAVVKAKLIPDGAMARLIASKSPDLSGPEYSSPDVSDLAANGKVVTLSLSNLAPNTQYYYAVEVNGVVDLGKTGRFRTFPAGAGSFTFAFASCAQTGSAHTVFTTIQSLDPLFFVHMGDMHYENIATNDRSRFRAAYDAVLASPTQSGLYRDVPIAYMWDDHDFGPNNSDSLTPGRLASRLTYQEYVPHYPLAAGNGDVAIYQTFSVGRVKFIMTDSRSARSPATAPDDAAKTMLGASQKAWFKQELLSAKGSYPLTVWVNTLPWIGVAGDDGWYEYTHERREIAEFIKANGITGLCMISGDAHMIAIDNGTHSDYASGGGAGFPVMQAAALDQSGSVKGGPYSEGAYPGRGQFGLMGVTDDGGPFIRVRWSGRTVANAEIVAYSFTVPVGGGPICNCASIGDVAGDDGVIDVFDVLALIGHVFRGDPPPLGDVTCPQADRGDVTCDGVDDVVDVVFQIGTAFRAGPLPCDPCTCSPYPTNCPSRRSRRAH